MKRRKNRTPAHRESRKLRRENRALQYGPQRAQSNAATYGERQLTQDVNASGKVHSVYL